MRGEEQVFGSRNPLDLGNGGGIDNTLKTVVSLSLLQK
jgi:hypothetical protein